MEHKTRVRVSNVTRDIASSVNNNVCTRDDGRKRRASGGRGGGAVERAR